MPRLLAALSAALLFSAPALAGLDPQEVGKIQEEQKAAADQVRAEHGNKPDQDLSPDERRQQDQELQKASLSVLQKHGVSDKEFTRYSERMDRTEQAQAEAARKQAEQKRAAAKPDPAKPPAPGAVRVQNGVSDANPLEVDVPTKENGVEIDRGTPVSELEGQGGGEAEPKQSSRSHRGSHSSASSHRSHGSRSSHHSKGHHHR